LEKREKVTEGRGKYPVLRLSVPKDGGYQDFEIPIKARLTMFLPKGSHIEAREKFIDYVRIPIDEKRSVFINFGSKGKLGFYASVRVHERVERVKAK
jgi:Zn-finger domain-containing protein